MRDPEGRLQLLPGRAVRHLADPTHPPAFLAMGAARQLVDAGLLVPFDMVAPGRVESPRYAFVSHPTEWSDAQLHDAALLTLQVAERILAARYELKDASAWNVIFDGCVPRFCDHLSFAAIERREWWAFGQFCRHFTFPLALAASRGQHGAATFRIHRDGLAASNARRLLGWRGLASRLLPLLWAANRAAGKPPAISKPPGTGDAARPLHQSLIAYARQSLHKPAGTTPGASPGWLSYVDTRSHYSEEASRAKMAQMAQWLTLLRPACVLDLGCNTGEFSRLALGHARRVIAVDADHTCVQTLYATTTTETRLHPVLANLGDLHGGRGWAATEFPGLLERLQGQSDLLLMLALTHHLHFSEGIPLPEIAALAASLTREHLVLELIAEDDEMVGLLAAQRQRPTASFGVALQEAAFNAHFDVLQRSILPGGRRQLLLMRKRCP